jgi:NADPH-dependent ferric siderophore reductase
VTEVWDLADHGDTRAVDAACRALLDPQHSHDQKRTVVLRLIFLGDPKAIPAIRAALRRISDPNSSSVPVGSTDEATELSRRHLENSLLQALDSCGDPELIDELNRVAATAATADNFATRYLATRDELPRW